MDVVWNADLPRPSCSSRAAPCFGNSSLIWSCPEDLHFLRAGGSTVLGTVAQEDDAWLEPTDQESRELLPRMPKQIVLRDHG